MLIAEGRAMNRIQSTVSSAVLVAALAGCGAKDDTGNAAGDGTPVTMDWTKGDTFHLAASYRRTNVKTEEIPVDLEAAFNGTATPAFGEHWTDDVVWTYQVVESNFVPSVDDELYRFAETAKGLESLAVIKASLDPSLNSEDELLSADPVVYMVFREARDRMVGLITFIDVEGERTERAYSASELERSWSTLSQSMLTKAPTYLAPYSARWGNDTRRLENGSEISSVKVDDATTDVFYTDEMGGGMVVSRYEAGQPWPTWTTSGNVDVRMLSASDLDELRFSASGILPIPDNEDFDYRAALQTSIDIDAAMKVDLEAFATGTVEAEVPQQFKPWAGAWWSLRKGLLIWGYDNRATFSDEIKDEVDPIKKDMDKLSKDIRDMDDEAEEREETVEAYREKQEELVGIIKDFYNGLLEGIDGGSIVIEDGKITKAGEEDGWEYELNELSPMDKFAVAQYLNGNTYPNPFLISGWEILNSYNPGGDSWWGHCNGWAAAAILTHEPRESLEFEVGEEAIEFTTADIKGLLTESHYGVFSQFYGARYNDEEDDVSDLSPKAFHKLVTFFIDRLGVPLVFDTTATEAVWNFPAYGYSMAVTETTDPNADQLVNVNTASVADLAALPGLGEALAEAIVEHRYDHGAFQAVDDLIEIDGIGEARFLEFRERVTVDPFARAFRIVASVTLTSDGVDEDHVDGDEPVNFKDTWTYTLKTDADGLVTGGEWDNEKDHPDFAWIPYHNTHRRETGGSENPFLSYKQLLDVVGDGIERN
jgi:competence ComEA-like helix-hairpin-helix protein